MIIIKETQILKLEENEAEDNFKLFLTSKVNDDTSIVIRIKLTKWDLGQIYDFCKENL